MIKLVLFSLLYITLLTHATHAVKNKNYENEVLKAYKNHWYQSKKSQEKKITRKHIKLYNYTQNQKNYDPITEFGFEYLHKLGMNGKGIEIAVIENNFIESEDIKFTKDTIIQAPQLKSAYENKKDLIEKLMPLLEEDEKDEYKTQLKELKNKYYDCFRHSLHVVGIINKIAPGITIYPIHALDFGNPDVFKEKLNNFSGSVITQSVAVGLSDEVCDILKPALDNKAYFRAASNEGCFLSEPHLQQVDGLPALHVVLRDITLVGNYNQEEKIIHETSNLPGKDYTDNFIFAEGTNIESLSVNENCEIINDKKTGTSFATPYVATVCALFAKYYPELPIKVIQQKLLESTDKFSKKHDPLIFGQGLMNTKKTLANLQKNADLLCDNSEIEQFAKKYFPNINNEKLEIILDKFNKRKNKKSISTRIYLINKFYEFNK